MDTAIAILEGLAEEPRPPPVPVGPLPAWSYLVFAAAAWGGWKLSRRSRPAGAS